ncbi:ABC transporter ATP-binding protein [Variovorax dokdonensis]|uniref:ABC transporter ATP-binding protein n=1 Tax=Variovorax dokdonensis TaxID=344883 RepID=A0ABT7NGH8_9BURK|nr:ABC transporter ATP-binding protein [Variovorax dokdonensis]MDM0047037.1 ABC transporter ATP-binding protein [Variovorax dokdonensis]
MLRCSGVSKRFANGTLALKDVDLQVGQHEFLSLLGPSGCGKSTLLRLISGLGQPSAGEIDWPTSNYDARGLARPDLSFVFQEPTLLPWKNALANVALPLKLSGVDKDERMSRAAKALASVGLAGFERSYPRELSGGMKMRVSIARALVTKPRILLMDEPFAALDEITRGRLNQDLLALWARERFTVIFVTHSVYESVFLSQRIVVMAARPGRVSADITVDSPYPREAGYRTSPAYAAHCNAVSAALEQAMNDARRAA